VSGVGAAAEPSRVSFVAAAAELRQCVSSYRTFSGVSLAAEPSSHSSVGVFISVQNSFFPSLNVLCMPKFALNPFMGLFYNITGTSLSSVLPFIFL
jgi:hypothetical protein